MALPPVVSGFGLFMSVTTNSKQRGPALAMATSDGPGMLAHKTSAKNAGQEGSEGEAPSNEQEAPSNEPKILAKIDYAKACAIVVCCDLPHTNS